MQLVVLIIIIIIIIILRRRRIIMLMIIKIIKLIIIIIIIIIILITIIKLSIYVINRVIFIGSGTPSAQSIDHNIHWLALAFQCMLVSKIRYQLFCDVASSNADVYARCFILMGSGVDCYCHRYQEKKQTICSIFVNSC